MAVALVLVATLAFFAVGTTAYRAGMARGVAESAKFVAPGSGSPGQFVHPYPPYWGPPHGFGFGFGFLIPLLFLFLLFGAFGRRRFGHGHGHGPGPGFGYGYGYGPGGRGCGAGGRGWEGGVPPAFEEWHRRAHEPKTEPAEKA